MTRYSIDGEPIHEFKWEKWGFFRLSFTIIAVVFALLMGLEWAADSLTPG